MLEYLNATFPQIQRITTYARSDTINRLKPERLERYAQLKLNRFHIGLETGNDYILKLMRKGVTKADQIKAGIRAKAAGIEINEFYVPNMGGREYRQAERPGHRRRDEPESTRTLSHPVHGLATWRCMRITKGC